MTTTAMTKDALVDLIAKHVNDSVAGLVARTVEAQMAPLAQKQTDWMTQILGRERAAEPPKTLEERSLRFGSMMRAMGATALALKQGQVVPPEAFLAKWGYADVAQEIKAGREKAMAAGDAAAGGFWVPPTYSQDVVEYLRARTVVRRLGARAVPVPTGTLKVPKLANGGTAYYVGENTNATITALAAGQLTLSFKKLVTMVPMSNDLVRYSTAGGGADAMARDDTVNAMRVREDQAFLRDDGTAATPRGIRFWTHPDHILAMSATTTVQHVFTNLGSVVQKLLDANMPMIAPAWIMAPRTEMFFKTLLTSNSVRVFPEMDGGRLWGFPYGSTTSVPTNLDQSGAGNNNESELYLVDMAQVIIGESLALQVDASQEAAYYDGSSVQAAYSLDQTVIRAIAEHDLGMRHDRAAAILTQLTWAPGTI